MSKKLVPRILTSEESMRNVGGLRDRVKIASLFDWAVLVYWAESKSGSANMVVGPEERVARSMDSKPVGPRNNKRAGPVRKYHE
ncbi:hypothetical protein Tco_0912419 [Tanacetum coccineum]